MRIALVSYIHGNLVALGTVLEATRLRFSVDSSGQATLLQVLGREGQVQAFPHIDNGCRP